MCIAVLAVSLGVTAEQSGDVPPVLAALREKYAAGLTLRAEFDLEIFWKAREKTERKSGVLYAAPDDRFRLELGKNVWVSDGRTYWQYSAATSQVVIKKLLDVDLSMHPSQIIETYLFKYSYSVSEQNEKQAVLSWRASAADAGTDARAVTIWVDVKKMTLKKLLIVDRSGNESTYTFKKMITGEQPPASAFTFDVPQGVSVLDTRE